MVWKMMMFEEIQDCCLVLGNLWNANGIILANSEFPCSRKTSIRFLLKRTYSVEEDVGWRIPRWLFSAWSSLMCEWDDFCQFWVIQVAWSLPSSFCSREYMVWQKMLVEEIQDGCYVHGHLWCVNGMILAISESPYCQKHSINFLIKRIYGLEEDVGWRIPRWLFSAWTSLSMNGMIFAIVE